MNREMRKFFKKLRREDNRGVTFKAFNGKIISDFEAEDLNLPEGYSIKDNEIYNGDIKIGELEVIDSFDESEEVDLEGFDDLDEDIDLEEEERKFSFRNGLNAIGYHINNFFENFGKRKKIELDDDLIEEDEEEQKNNLNKGVSQKPTKPSLSTSSPSKVNSNEIEEINKSLSEIAKLFGYIDNMIQYNGKEYFNEYIGSIVSCKGEYNQLLNNKQSINLASVKSLQERVTKIYGSMGNKTLNNTPTNISKNTKRTKKYRKLSGLKSLDTAGAYVRNFFYGIANGVSNFFENFGKRKEIVIDDDFVDVSEEDEAMITSNSNPAASSSSNSDGDKKELEKKYDELINKFVNLKNLTNNKINRLNEETKIKYEYAEITATSMLVGLPSEKLKELYKDGGSAALESYFKSHYSLKEQINKVEAAIKYLDDVNKSLDEDLKKIAKKTSSGTRKYSFNSEEEVRDKFKEYDNYESIEEKIKYYEEFLKNHDLSHKEDKPMKERMEQKLAALKQKYTDNGKNADSDNRSEQMAYYTQMAMGVDKKIARMNKERQLKILQAELEGKNIVNLGLAEERKLYEEKIKLLRLKKECLERKAQVNKYYEEKAARMTEALKR